MLTRIKNLFLGDAGGGAGGDHTQAGFGDKSLRAAAAALLIEAALMDGNFDADERTTIARLLGESFEMDAAGVEALIRDAEVVVGQSVELYGFTRTLKDGLDQPDRVRIIEMLWEVAYADGVIHDYEANLVRRACGLLHVTDQDGGAARKRVRERLDIAALGG